MFELTIKTDNPEVLKAVAVAVKNAPPATLQVSDSVPVNVHASIKDMKAAVDNLDAVPEAKVVEQPSGKPLTEPVPLVEVEADVAPTEDVAKEKGQRLRQLILAVSKLPDHTIQSAKEVAAKAADITPDKIDKDFPKNPKVDAAISALAELAS